MSKEERIKLLREIKEERKDIIKKLDRIERRYDK